MKKATGILLVSLCMALLVGCSSTPAAENINEAIEAWRKSREASESQTEIEEFTSGQFAGVLGFNVTSYPDNQSLQPYKYFAIDGWFGQIQYKTPDERVLVVRVADKDAKRLLKTYTEPHTLNIVKQTIDGIEVEVRTAPEGCMAVVWKRGDFQYLVHSRESQGAIPQEEIEALVKGLDSQKA